LIALVGAHHFFWTRTDLKSGHSGGTCETFFSSCEVELILNFWEHVAFDHAFEVGGRYSRDLYSFRIFGLLMSSGSDKFVVGYRQSPGGLSFVADLVWI
jgi:hypothetical protein